MKKKYNDSKKKYTKNYDSRKKRKQYQLEEEYNQLETDMFEDMFNIFEFEEPAFAFINI